MGRQGCKQEQKLFQEKSDSLQKNEALPSASHAQPNVSSPGSYYDTENNPILIGYWNLNECGSRIKNTYARHTLGSKSSTTNSDYLTSYGDASWYNTSGKNALPYRNGSSSTGQNTVDVKMGISFDIRDINKNSALSVGRTDFGPNQCPGSRYVSVVADLDKTTFTSLHGNSSDGIFYARTWVPLTNWNPA